MYMCEERWHTIFLSFPHGEEKNIKLFHFLKKFQGYTNQMVREGHKLFDEKLSAQGPFPMP